MRRLRAEARRQIADLESQLAEARAGLLACGFRVGGVLGRLQDYNPPDRTVDKERQIAVDIQDAAAEIKRLNKLSTCGCGDGFTESDPGHCGNCTVQYRLEIERLKAELAEANADLEAYKFQIEGYSARLAEARDENRALRIRETRP